MAGKEKARRFWRAFFCQAPGFPNFFGTCPPSDLTGPSVKTIDFEPRYTTNFIVTQTRYRLSTLSILRIKLIGIGRADESIVKIRGCGSLLPLGQGIETKSRRFARREPRFRCKTSTLAKGTFLFQSYSLMIEVARDKNACQLR